jgi:hypothetical protein
VWRMKFLDANEEKKKKNWLSDWTWEKKKKKKRKKQKQESGKLKEEYVGLKERKKLSLSFYICFVLYFSFCYFSDFISFFGMRMFLD